VGQGGIRNIYLDDSTNGLLVFGNVIITNDSPGTNYSCQFHGGDNCIFRNNVCLIRATNEKVMFYQEDPSNVDTTGVGNVIDRNIFISVDANLAFTSYGNNNWRQNSGTMGTPTVQNNVLWEDINFDGDESSSTDADPNFDNYDPANKILELNSGSPAYTEGFVDIAGVTDGGTFNWGTAGYDRNNY
jgi:hypothetical protein